jgi:hypothetical protein
VLRRGLELRALLSRPGCLEELERRLGGFSVRVGSSSIRCPKGWVVGAKVPLLYVSSTLLFSGVDCVNTRLSCPAPISTVIRRQTPSTVSLPSPPRRAKQTTNSAEKATRTKLKSSHSPNSSINHQSAFASPSPEDPNFDIDVRNSGGQGSPVYLESSRNPPFVLRTRGLAINTHVRFLARRRRSCRIFFLRCSTNKQPERYL